MILHPVCVRQRRTSSAVAWCALSFLVLGLLVVLPIVLPASPASAAVDPCGTGGNKIACENSKPGSPPSVWDIDGAGSDAIQGFSTDISTNVGKRVDFKIDTDASAYNITVFRTGWYAGNGARQIATVTPSVPLPQAQPTCISDVTTELYDCGNWGVSASWTVPSTAVSGVYIALLEIPATGEASHITFIVRDDASRSDVVFQTSDPTWQAYNTYGGSDFYQGAANGRAHKISYNRPVLTRDGIGGRDFYFANEYPLVRFLERNGYDVSYIAGVDTDRAGELLKNHKTFLSVGHDEYWSGAQRANVEAARDSGVNLQFLSGNEVYWRTRYETSADAARTPYRTLVSYKETWSYAKIDPSTEWTGTWRDPRYAAASQGAGLPENALTGTAYYVNNDDLALQVSQREGRLRLWRNTSVASLGSGAKATLAPHTIGYESDEDIDNGFRPAGLVRLSTTTGPTPEYLTDFGNTTVPGTTTHNLTMYKAASGALVFGAGTVQWTWGLDATHDSPYAAEPADLRMQQAQVNLLADMGAQPTTLMSGLVATAKTTDTAKPTATFSAPAANAAIANGANVTASGSMSDSGGVVAGVEVSTDAGDSWHPATMSSATAWTYAYVQHGTGSTSLRVRATDDSGNIGAVTTRAVTVACPCSVYGATVPKIAAAEDPAAAELGLRFSPDVAGFVSGVRFYKGAGNTGTHVGSVWSAAGERLATATFTGETATGWQTVSFSSAVPVAAGQTYVVSYTAPSGRYANQSEAFSSRPLRAAPLTVAGGFGVPPAGVFSNPGTYPDRSYRNASYFVDPVFSLADTSPLTVISRTPTPGNGTAPRATVIKATYSKPLVAGTATISVKSSTGATVSGTTAYDATTRTISLTPSALLPGGVAYTVTVTGRDSLNQAVSANGTWGFTSAQPQGGVGLCPCSLFSDESEPAVLEVADTGPVTLGVRFSPEVDGTITGVRFYKGAGNTGTHTGTLWSRDGTQLATGSFANETGAGWQMLTFATPVAVTAGAEYVASYRAPIGRYSATPNAFTGSDLSRSPLRVGAAAGAYSYSSAFPGSSSSTNYLVDVVFQRPPVAFGIAAQVPAPGALDVGRSEPVSVTFSKAVKAGATLTLKAGTTAIATTSALDAAATTLTATPGTTLPAGTDITVTLSDVQATDGATLAGRTWTYRTAAANAVAPQTIFGDAQPAVASEPDSSPVEVGTAFTPTRSGVIRALRFLKGPGNGGTHVGSLWSAAGVRLAQVTFTNETATGWQRAALSSPYRVTAGTTYVVSYLAPQGHYADTPRFFAQPVTSGNLTMPSGGNGRYLYGAAGGFPVYSYQSTAYFADVEFASDVPALAVATRSPANGATGIATDVTPIATFNDAVSAGTLSLASGTTALSGTSARSADGTRLTFTPAQPLPSGTDITVRLTGVTSADGRTLADSAWTFRTTGSTTAPTTLFTTQTPDTASANDSSSVELGVSFVASVAGEVTGVRFYKGPANTGTHVGNLWSSTGALLATGTFTGETAGGWQRLDLPTPVPLTPGETYVVSYYAPEGGYAVTSGAFTSDYVSGALRVPGGGVNGRYRYASGGGFPASSYGASNYFVDVIFRPAP